MTASPPPPPPAPDEVAREVIATIARIANVPAERLGPETDFRRDLRIDSLLGLRILAALEKRFGFTVPDEEIDRCRTVAAAIEIVKSRTAGKA